ncbi:hypothetical protein [Rhodococcus qingshengii]
MFATLNGLPIVKQALIDRGKVIAATAQAITDADGGSATISLEIGVRPKGRSFVNVKSNKRAEEYGDEKTKRIRAIGRAIRET